ncbi:MAG: PP2C family protein-serine/threonine phosphatase [Candidatus Marithrix sp.]|nr:PP2C family protein-serine/threonine phosphatase [Candidatus Marithrix sp.]
MSLKLKLGGLVVIIALLFVGLMWFFSKNIHQLEEVNQKKQAEQVLLNASKRLPFGKIISQLDLSSKYYITTLIRKDISVMQDIIQVILRLEDKQEFISSLQNTQIDLIAIELLLQELTTKFAQQYAITQQDILKLGQLELLADKVETLVTAYNEYLDIEEIRIKEVYKLYSNISIGIMLIAISIVFLILYFNILQPVARLTSLTEEVLHGNYKTQIPVTSGDELGKLANSFNLMTKNLLDSFTVNLRMKAELDVAKHLQQMVLPKDIELQHIEKLDITGFMEPASEVGGDYYEVLNHDGHIKIGIGDVTGHGLESGVVMLMVQTTVRALLLAGITEPEKFLNIVNRTIYHNVQRMETDKNLTLSLLDYHNGILQLTGQHEEVLLVRKNGKIERIDTFDLGFMIGLEKDISEFASHQEIVLQSGDGIVLYTDGITEARNINKQLYSLERLCKIVSHNWSGTSKQIQQAVIADVKDYIGKQTIFDDITLLVLKQK